MAGLATAKGLLTTATVLSGVGGVAGITAERRAASDEAGQARREATAARASASLAAAEEIRRSRLVKSRARAVAAASGAGVTDPSVVRLMGDIEAEGLYGAMARLYEGHTQAQGLEDFAKARKREGKARMFATGVDSASTVLRGVETLRTRYGGRKPNASTP